MNFIRILKDCRISKNKPTDFDTKNEEGGYDVYITLQNPMSKPTNYLYSNLIHGLGPLS